VRLFDEDARDHARRLCDTPAYAQSCRERKKVEMLSPHLKPHLKLTRLRLCGLAWASEEFLLAATAPEPAQAGEADREIHARVQHLDRRRSRPPRS
jgi:hypothetical protein